MFVHNCAFQSLIVIYFQMKKNACHRFVPVISIISEFNFIKSLKTEQDLTLVPAQLPSSYVLKMRLVMSAKCNQREKTCIKILPGLFTSRKETLHVKFICPCLGFAWRLLLEASDFWARHNHLRTGEPTIPELKLFCPLPLRDNN